MQQALRQSQSDPSQLDYLKGNDLSLTKMQVINQIRHKQMILHSHSGDCIPITLAMSRL